MDALPSPEDPELDWPDSETIRMSQQGYCRLWSSKTNLGDDGLYRMANRVWIPEEDSKLQIKILIVGHCGKAGHRSSDSTESSITEEFYWKNMRLDTTELDQACLHCIIAKSVNKAPRPLSMTTHATSPKQDCSF